MKAIAANSDGIVLMNYDEHEATSDPRAHREPGMVRRKPDARVLKSVQKQKLICALSNYGYDWTLSIPEAAKKGHKRAKAEVLNTEDLPVSDAWQRASDADADLDLNYDALNPHYEYIDEDNNQRHVVWFTDAVTLLDEMRAARQLGLQTFALWRLGSEDSSLWNVWDKPSNPNSLEALSLVEPGPQCRYRRRGRHHAGDGPATSGKADSAGRYQKVSPICNMLANSIIDEHMDIYPQTYSIAYYGYHPNQVALSFDDGPDPKWTPRILDILKEKRM